MKSRRPQESFGLRFELALDVIPKQPLTARLVMPLGQPDDAVIDAIQRGLHERFDIAHSTLQVARVFSNRACALLRAEPSPAHR